MSIMAETRAALLRGWELDFIVKPLGTHGNGKQVRLRGVLDEARETLRHYSEDNGHAAGLYVNYMGILMVPVVLALNGPDGVQLDETFRQGDGPTWH